MKPLFFLTVLFLFSLSAFADKHGKHLFILSGQSNMQGHRPEEAFIPMVNKAFGNENVIVVQDALGGQPIYRWYKKWRHPEGDSAETKPESTGDLYDRLMGKVRTTIKNQRVLSVSFVWMQGERHAKMGWGKIYEKALIGLHNQLANDLKWKENDIGFVIGRLSDFDMDNKRYPHWTIIRDVQERVSNSKENFLLVNTDDLNDGFNRKGKAIKDDLHYSAEGYKILGHRFAKACIQIIKNKK